MTKHNSNRSASATTTMRKRPEPSNTTATFTAWALMTAGALFASLLSVAEPAAAENEATAEAKKPKRPNILWISCEDISSHLGCYGSKDAITPTLDALAARGIRFSHAFTTCPVCATNRSSIITGMYPTSIGTHLMRCKAKLPPEIKCFTEYLRDAGYYCTNDNKTDYNFEFPKSAWDLNGIGAHWRRRSEKEQPFFHVRNFVNTHESRIWPRGEGHAKLTPRLKKGDHRDPAKVTLPPYYPDTKEARRDWANYHEAITELDYRAGELLEQLEEDGLADDTIVFFWSDHGVGLPRGKRWLYDSGTRVPFIVYVPEKFRTSATIKSGTMEPGSASKELISYVDLAPTVLSLAGVKIPDHMQGHAFLGPAARASRDFVISVRDRMDERYDMMRTVRDHRWRYNRNFMPWKPYAQWLQYAETNTTMQALRRLQAEGNLPPAATLFMSDRKPIEELYDTESDPHELTNLATSKDPEHQAVLKKMRERLYQWQEETLDLGFLPEPALTAGERSRGSRYAILRGDKGANRVAKLRAIADAAAHGDVVVLSQSLDNADSAVRYWAVVGLGRQLVHPGPNANDIVRSTLLESMRNAALDEDTSVRIAAAENLCRLEAAEEGLAILTAALAHDDAWVRLLAGTALDELDELARPAAARMQKALQAEDADGYRYYRAVVGRALKELAMPKIE